MSYRFTQGQWIFKGMVFDRYIFRAAMWLSFAYLLFVAWSYDFNMDYYSCELPDGYNAAYQCHNPFYRPTTWKNHEFLAPGEYGQKLGSLFSSAYWVPIMFIIIGFIMNHLFYNKGKKIAKMELES